jgi:hypothetical protein
MNRSEDGFDPVVRMVPKEWIRADAGRCGERLRKPHSSSRNRWMSTVPAALDRVRACAMLALEELQAEVAYLYEDDAKVVIRCTLPGRQIRAELRPLETEALATRIVVVVSRGTEVDREASGKIVQSIEAKLQTESTGY